MTRNINKKLQEAIRWITSEYNTARDEIIAAPADERRSVAAKHYEVLWGYYHSFADHEPRGSEWTDQMENLICIATSALDDDAMRNAEYFDRRAQNRNEAEAA